MKKRNKSSRDVEWIVGAPVFFSDALNPSLATSPWSGHRNFAYDLMAFIKPRRVVELGTHYGASFFSFLQASRDFDLSTEHVAVDTWEGEEHSGRYGVEVFEIFNMTISKFFSKQQVRILRKHFDDALVDVQDCSVDILHIDGFHSYDAVSHDYSTWLPKLAPNGIVLFHDVAPRSGYGSAAFWHEVKQSLPHFEFLEHSFGLGILFPKGIESYYAISKHLNSNVLNLYRFKAEFSLRDRQYDDAKARLEERWLAMQSMEAMIRERDEAIAGQARMLDERWLAMQSMEATIRERDEAIIEQRQLLEKRPTVTEAMRVLLSAVRVSFHHRVRRVLGKRW